METQKVTLVEFLVVLTIVALVGVLSAVAVGAARAKSRDAVRLSNVRQIQSALEDYFNENNAYPVGAGLPLGDVAQSACLGITGFHGNCAQETATIMRQVPRTYESGLSGESTCGTPARNAFCYTVLGQTSDAYGIQFELEHDLTEAGLQKGVNCAVPGKMSAGRCPQPTAAQ